MNEPNILVVELPDESAAWVHGLAEHRGVSDEQVVRDLLEILLQAGLPDGSPE